MQIRPWTLPSSPDCYLARQVSWLRFIAALCLPGSPVAFFKAASRYSGGSAPDFHRTSLFSPKKGTLKAHIFSFTTIINLAKAICQVFIFRGLKLFPSCHCQSRGKSRDPPQNQVPTVPQAARAAPRSEGL